MFNPKVVLLSQSVMLLIMGFFTLSNEHEAGLFIYEPLTLVCIVGAFFALMGLFCNHCQSRSMFVSTVSWIAYCLVKGIDLVIQTCITNGDARWDDILVWFILALVTYTSYRKSRKAWDNLACSR